MTGIKIELCTDGATWNEFLESQPHPWPFSRWEWRAILKEAYGVDCHYLIASIANEPIGTLALYSHPFGFRGKKQLSSVRNGLIAGDEEAIFLLIEAADKLREKIGACSGSISTGIGAPNCPYTHKTRKTFLFDLFQTEDQVWKGLRDKTRNMIRKGERAGLFVQTGMEYFDAVYNLYSKEMLARGVNIYSPTFFRKAAQHLGNRFQVLAALHENEVVGGTLILQGKGIAVNVCQAQNWQARSMAPIQFMNWEIMKQVIRNGGGIFDMGESTPGSTVFKSKANFGGTEHTTRTYKLPLTPERDANDEDVQSSSQKQQSRRSLGLIAHSYLVNHAPDWLRMKYAVSSQIRGRII